MPKDGNKQVVKPQVEEMDPLQKRALAILKGDEEPPNEMIAYVVKRAKQTRGEAEQLTKKLEELQMQLKALQTKIIELRGAAFNYADDVKALLKEKPRVVQPPQKRIVTP